MKKNVSLIFVTVFALFFIMGCNSQRRSSHKSKKLEVDIACNLPLTGDFATYGEAVKDGAMLALDSIPNDSIILNFNWQDNASKAKNAVSVFKKQLFEGFDIYVSGVKPQTMAIFGLVSKTGKPHFVWVFDAFITNKHKNTFRTWVNYKDEPIYYLKYVDSLKPARIAIIYAQLPHTDEEFNGILIPKLKKRGIKNLFVEPYTYNRDDFKNIAAKVRDFKPDLLILNGFKGNLINMIKSFREYNLIKSNNTICTYDLLDAAEDLSPQMLEGLRVIVPQFETRTSKRLNDWKIAFHKKYHRKARYTDAYAYDMTYAIYYAAKNKKPNESFTNALLNVNFNGITGPFSFDSTGDLKLNLDIGYYKNGKLLFEHFKKR